MSKLNKQKTISRFLSSKIVPKLLLWLTVFILGFALTGEAQTTYYSKASATDFTSTASWGTATDGSGTAPSSISNADIFIIQNGSIMNLNSGSATVRKLTINAGSLSVSSNTLTISIASQNNTELNVTNGGTLNVSASGTVQINGAAYFADGSSLIQSGGLIKLNPNSGTATTSIGSTATAAVTFGIGYSAASGSSSISTVANASKFQLTGGTLQIVDPVLSTSTTCYSLAYRGASGVHVAFGTGHTVKYGDGVSTLGAGSTNGFYNYFFVGSGYLSVGNMICDLGASGTNRFLNFTSTVGVLGNLTVTSGEMRTGTGTFYVAGNITNNTTLTANGTLYLGTWSNGSVTTTSQAQTISGAGVFRNLATSPTANYTSMNVNNSSASGVTFSSASSLSGTGTGTVSGTLTFTNGIINTGSNTFTLGIATGTLGTLSYTNGGFGNGSSFAKWFAAAGTSLATITSGSNPSGTTTGFWPFVSGNPVSGMFPRHFYRTTGTFSTGGPFKVTFNDGTGSVALSPTVTSTYVYDLKSNVSWTTALVSPAVLSATTLPSYAVVAPGAINSATGHTILLNGTTLAGTAATGTIYPTAQSTSLSTANQIGTFTIGTVNSETPIQTATSGEWNNTSTWVGGVVPACGQAVFINVADSVWLNGSTANCGNITNNGKLNILSGTLTIGCTKNDNYFTNNNKFYISGGTVNINGNWANPNGSGVYQTGGSIIIDGNSSGSTSNSVVSGTPLLSFGNSTTAWSHNSSTRAISLTGGSITIVDPHTAATNTSAYALYSNITSGQGQNAGSGHTFNFGDGSSSDAGGNTSGFYVNNQVAAGLNFGNVYINNPSGTNRIVTQAGTPQGINGNFTVNSGEFTNGTNVTGVMGNLVVNSGGIITATGTFNFARYVGTTPNSDTLTQSVTVNGTGIIRNLATSPTANFTNVNINNNGNSQTVAGSYGGVTFNPLNAISGQPSNSTSISGTLTFTLGKAIVPSGSSVILGVSTPAAGTLTYTSGGFASGSTFGRWHTATTTGTIFTAGTDPSGTTSQYPFINTLYQTRHSYIERVTPTAGGILAITYNETAGVSTGLSITDPTTGYVVTDRSNDNWSVSTLGTTPSATTYKIGLTAPSVLGGTLSADSTRVLQASSFIGTHQRGSITPGGQRIGLSLSDLTSGAFYLGANSNEIPNLSAASGDWETPSTWSKGTVPTCGDVVTIQSGHTVVVNNPGNTCKGLTINAGGVLTSQGASELTVGCSDNNNLFTINGGTYNMIAGTLTVNGKFALNAVTTGVFTQSGGNIIVDGNNGNLTKSVQSHIVDMYSHNASTLQLTDGTFTVVDPVLYGTAGTYWAFKIYPSVAASSGPNWTLNLGDGVSTNNGGNSDGMNINLTNVNSFAIGGTLNINLVTNGTTNRYVTTSNAIPVNNLTITKGEYRFTSQHYIKGNITNNDTLTSSSTSSYITLADFSGSTSSVNANPQTIGGTGYFRNATTNASKTADIIGMTINNSNSTGVTFNRPISISGTLTMTSGILNTTSTNILQLGTSTASGTLACTPSNTNFIKGPFARTFASSRTATGTYTVATLFPVGKGTTSLPIYYDPSTSATGPIVITAEGFDSYSGSGGAGVSNLATKSWYAEATTNPTNMTNAYIKILDAGVATTSKLVQSSTLNGSYSGVIGGSVAVATTSVTSATAILKANLGSYLTYGDLANCAAPTDQATAITSSLMNSTSFTGTISPASSAPTGYIVVRMASGVTPTSTPVDGTLYTAASANFGGTVVGNYYSPTLSFNETGLTAGTTYDYWVYTFNNGSCNGPTYNLTSPLVASITTCATATGTPGTPVASAVTTTDMVLTWTASSTTGVDYILDVATNSSFTTMVSGYNGLNVGTGTLTYPVTGLSAATTYYARVRAVVSGCYSAVSSTVTQTTLCLPLTTFPWTENFDSYSFTYSSTTQNLPPCWTGYKAGSYPFTLSNAASNTSYNDPYGGIGNYLTTYYTSSISGIAYVYTPAMQLTAGVSYDFSFDFVGDGLAGNNVNAIVNTASSTTGSTVLGTVISGSTTSTSGTNYTNYKYSFVPSTSGIYYFGATYYSSTSAPFYQGYDNFKVELSPACTGANGGTVAAAISSSCGATNTTTLTGSGYSTGNGIAYQWQSSNDNFVSNIVNISGQTNPLSATTGTFSVGANYFRLKVTCTPTSTDGYSNVAIVNYSNPTPASTSPATRCGVGTVTLGATANSGDVLSWYAGSTGGTPLAFGTSYTTPSIGSTTNYYVSAYSPAPGSNVTQGAGATTSATYSNPFYSAWSNIHTQHLITAAELSASGLTTGNINSVALNVTSVGSYPMIDLSVKIGTTTNTTAASFVTSGLTQVYTNASLMPVSGSNVLTFSSPFYWDGTSNIVLDFSHGNSSSTLTMSRTVLADNTSYVSSIKTHVSAATSAATISSDITTNLLTYSVRPQFKFNGTGKCEGARTAVTATVNTPPSLTTVADATICNATIKMLDVTSTLSDFDTYAWSPITNLYTDASATVPYTAVSGATTVYYKNTTGKKDTFYVSGVNNTSGCQNQDTVVITNMPSITMTASTAQICVSGTTTLGLTPTTNYGTGTIQWQSSTTGGVGTYTNISGQTANTYTTPTISSDMYYGVVVTDGTNICSDNPTTHIVVNNPQVVTTTPGVRCGTGTVDLLATTNAGSSLSWYSASTGGTPIGTGTTFTTPSINSTTTYYVAANVGGTNLNGGKPSTNGADGTNTTGGIYFTANTPFTLNSVKMYPTAAGTNTIVLYSGSTTSGTALQTTSYTFTGANTSTGVNVPLNWTIPAGTYTIYQSVSGASCYRDYSASLPATAYPYNIGSACTLTGGSLAGYYYFFYDWAISTGCESARTAVTATVNTPPTLTISAASASVCAGSTTTTPVDVTSTIANYSTYSWSPSTGVTGTTSATFSTSANTIYTLTASDATSGCVSTATVSVTALPLPSVTSSATPSSICAGTSLALNASSPTTGYTMNSNSNVQFIDISTSGTSVGTPSDDGEYNVTLPSAFLFNGTTYTTARIGNNGVMMFGSNAGDINYGNMALPATLGANNSGLMTNVTGSTLTGICANWDDMTPAASGTSINTQTVGNLYIVQWTNEDNFNATGTGTITFQIQLDQSNGQIHLVYNDINYGAAGFDGAESATIGLNFSASSALQYSFNTNSILNGQSITFTPNNNALSWTGPNSFTSTSANPTISAITAAGAGSYQVTATGSNGCTATSSTIVDVKLPSTSTTNVTICSSALPYMWNGTNRTTAGTYTYTTPNSVGCDSVATLVLTVNSLPTVTATASSTSICTGSNLTLTGGGATSYTWSDGTNTPTDATPFAVTSSSTYTVTGTDANGCSATSTTAITVNSLPTVTATASATTLCSGDNLTLTGGGATSYTWSDGTNTPTDATAFAVSAGTSTYTVTGTDGNSCSATSTVDITVNNCSTGTAFDVVAFIQGYYTGSGTMQSVLTNQNVAGASATDADTVTVELRDAAFDLIDSYTGVMNTSGTVSCNFAAATASTSYWIVLKHRSSVETWSAAQVSLVNNGSYDFTTAATQAYGSNMIDNGDGSYSIISGDLDQDGSVGISDLNLLDADFQSGLGSEYFSTDLNGDGSVGITDLNLLDSNFQLGVGKINP